MPSFFRTCALLLFAKTFHRTSLENVQACFVHFTPCFRLSFNCISFYKSSNLLHGSQKSSVTSTSFVSNYQRILLCHQWFDIFMSAFDRFIPAFDIFIPAFDRLFPAFEKTHPIIRQIHPFIRQINPHIRQIHPSFDRYNLHSTDLPLHSKDLYLHSTKSSLLLLDTTSLQNTHATVKYSNRLSYLWTYFNPTLYCTVYGVCHRQDTL